MRVYFSPNELSSSRESDADKPAGLLSDSCLRLSLFAARRSPPVMTYYDVYYLLKEDLFAEPASRGEFTSPPPPPRLSGGYIRRRRYVPPGRRRYLLPEVNHPMYLANLSGRVLIS